MKRRNRAQTSSLFLLELILAILFFSLAGSVCVQFFVKSHLLSQDARALDHAVSECTGIAEIVSSSESLEEAVSLISEAYPQSSPSEDTDTIEIYYDTDFSVCSREQGRYTQTVRLLEKERMLTASLSMGASDSEPIYELSVEHYLQRRSGDGEE